MVPPDRTHLKGRGQCPSSSLWCSTSWGGRTTTSSFCSRFSDIIIHLVAGDNKQNIKRSSEKVLVEVAACYLASVANGGRWWQHYYNNNTQVMKIVLVLTKVWLLKHVSDRTGGKANSPTPPPGWNQSAASNIIILQAASLLLPIREQATNEKWLTKRGKDIVVFGVQWGVGDRVLWLVGGHLWLRWIRAKRGDSLLCCHGNNMKKRDLLFLVFVCAKFRRGFFLLQLNEGEFDMKTRASAVTLKPKKSG